MLDLEATLLADFLGKILQWEPKDRPTAQEMLSHPWLKMMPRYDIKISRKESREYRKMHGYQMSPSKKSSSSSSSSSEEESSDDS
jgi:serine/threonine protein kinase